VKNNPLKYTDPSGHLALLPTALIGGAVGATISVASQMYTAHSEGNATNLSEAWHCVDPAKVAGAAVGGAVAGATMGLVAPGAMAVVMPKAAMAFGETALATHAVGAITSVGAGGLANVLGGQAGSLAEGAVAETLESAENNMAWNVGDAYERAHDNGFLSLASMQKDALVGGVSGGIGYGIDQTMIGVGLGMKPNWRLQNFSDRVNYAEQLLSRQQVSTILGMEVLNEVNGNIMEYIVEKRSGRAFE